MSIQVDFPADIEQTLQQRALAAGVDVATFVRAVVTEKLEEEMTTDTKQKSSHDEFARRLQSWVELHPVRENVVDDSRESIYAGRGE